MRNTETELRAQLSTAADECKTLNTELEELRRRITQVESEKKDVDNQLEEVNKARTVMMKKIEIVSGCFRLMHYLHLKGVVAL